jgi:hypothetical protein
MKARDLLRAVEQYTSLKQYASSNPEEALQKLSDEQLKTAVRVSAELFSTTKKEAERRGIWDELIKGLKVK